MEYKLQGSSWLGGWWWLYPLPHPWDSTCGISGLNTSQVQEWRNIQTIKNNETRCMLSYFEIIKSIYMK
jgi:hypothetical protein